MICQPNGGTSSQLGHFDFTSSPPDAFVYQDSVLTCDLTAEMVPILYTLNYLVWVVVVGAALLILSNFLTNLWTRP